MKYKLPHLLLGLVLTGAAKADLHTFNIAGDISSISGLTGIPDGSTLNVRFTVDDEDYASGSTYYLDELTLEIKDAEGNQVTVVEGKTSSNLVHSQRSKIMTLSYGSVILSGDFEGGSLFSQVSSDHLDISFGLKTQFNDREFNEEEISALSNISTIGADYAQIGVGVTWFVGEIPEDYTSGVLDLDVASLHDLSENVLQGLPSEPDANVRPESPKRSDYPSRSAYLEAYNGYVTAYYAASSPVTPDTDEAAPSPTTLDTGEANVRPESPNRSDYPSRSAYLDAYNEYVTDYREWAENQ